LRVEPFEGRVREVRVTGIEREAVKCERLLLSSWEWLRNEHKTHLDTMMPGIPAPAAAALYSGTILSKIIQLVAT
jgi:hypothetical protein